MTLLGAGGGAAQTADAPGPPRELRDVKVEQRATAAAVTVATSGQPKYETTRLDSPVRLMIDISRTFASAGSRWTDVPEPLTEVRGSQLTPGTARRVVELNRKAGYRIEERPQGLTVLIDAPGRAGDGRDLPAVEAGLRGPGGSFRECRRRRSRPMRRRPPAHSRRTSRREPSGSQPSRCWRRRQPFPASSPPTSGPCARPRLPASSWPRRRPRRPRRRAGSGSPERVQADHARVQGCRRHQPPPHSQCGERPEYRCGRRRQGQALGLPAQRDLGAGARHDPRGQGPAEDRQGRCDPHHLDRAARQGARSAGPRRRRQAESGDRRADEGSRGPAQGSRCGEPQAPGGARRRGGPVPGPAAGGGHPPLLRRSGGRRQDAAGHPRHPGGGCPARRGHARDRRAGWPALIAEPPFSALYGVGLQQQQARPHSGLGEPGRARQGPDDPGEQGDQ